MSLLRNLCFGNLVPTSSPPQNIVVNQGSLGTSCGAPDLIVLLYAIEIINALTK